jgi:two-component system sensor histidine kinase RegB
MKYITDPLAGLGSLFLLPLDGKDPSRERVLWLQRLRLRLFPGVALLFILGLRFHFIASSDWTLFFLATAILLGTFFFTRARLMVNREVNTIFLLINLLIDLITFALFLLASKGLANPFIYAIFIHAFMGGMLLELKYSMIFELIVHFTLFSIQYLSLKEYEFVWFDVLPLIATQHFLCLLSWAISTSLARHLDFGFKQISNLKTANEKADRLRALGALSSGFSHEFASPLNTIKLKLQRMSRLDEFDVFGEDIQVLANAVNKCDDTLKRMNTSLFDSENLCYQDIDVYDFLEDVIKVWEQDKVGAIVENKVSQTLRLKLPTFNFTQIILFLMDNSFEASPNKCKIKISSNDEEPFVVLSFCDQGKGFSNEVLNRLGEPFNSDKTHGVGLGLFSADIFMISVGGHIEVKNQPTGACVRLSFPLTLQESIDSIKREG